MTKFIIKSKKEISFFLLSFTGAFLLFFIIRPYNLGFSPDSMAYLEVAENLTKGNGIVNNAGEVVSHWPPLFPFVLSLMSEFLGVELIKLGIILQPVLFFSFLLVFFYILDLMKVDIGIILISGSLLMVSQVVKNFLWYLSEPLFLFLLLVSFYFFLKWIQKKKRGYLIVTGIICGFLLLTRYAGIGFIGGYALSLLLIDKCNFKNFKQLALFFTPILLIGFVWFFYLISFESDSDPQKFNFHLIPLFKIKDLFYTFAYWFFGSYIAILCFSVLFIFYLLNFRKIKACKSELKHLIFKKYRTEIITIFCLIGVYLGFLITSISLYYPSIPLNNRILGPLFPFLMILITLIFQIFKKKGLDHFLYGTSLVFLISFSSTILPSYINHYEKGGGYSQKKWQQNKVIATLEKMNLIHAYSNGIELTKIFLLKDYKILPSKFQQEDFEKLVEDVKKGKTAIVYFNEVNWRNNLISKDRILKKFDESAVIHLDDGFIVKVSQK